MHDFLLSIAFGGGGGALIVWLLRGWLTERLKQSIAHEYAEKLQTHKTELDAKLQAIRHEYEVNQLRTSLFFNHQRTAFAELLSKIAEIDERWWAEGAEPDSGVIKPVPNKLYQELKRLFYKHQLFLDPQCVMAMELLFETYQDSMPFDDGSGALIERDVRQAYDNVAYLQPRLASLFQQRIGLERDTPAAREIALLGAIRTLNKYHFADIGLPASGNLKLEQAFQAAEAVTRADRYFEDLTKKLREFEDYLSTKTFFFHEARASIARYLAVLAPAKR